MDSLAVVDDVDGNSDEEVLSLPDHVNEINLSKTDKVIANWKDRKNNTLQRIKYSFYNLNRVSLQDLFCLKIHRKSEISELKQLFNLLPLYIQQ